jgi:hypothetical protein
MAQFLSEKHSVNVHLSIVKRHIRLSRHIKGAEELGAAIEPAYGDLVAKSASATTVTEDTEFKRDLVSFKNTLLGDRVRDVSAAAKKYDRDNPGLTISGVLFPDGISPLIYAPYEEAPAVAEELILKIRNLGDGHPLAEYIAPLRTAIDESKEAIVALRAAVSAQKTADALVDIAKTNLTRQYEQNIHAAGSKFGKVYANRLFPPINKSSKNGNNEETDKPET